MLMRRGFMCAVVCIVLGVETHAQNNAIERYRQFKEQAKREYADFRRKCNAEYAKFLMKAWRSYEMGPVIPLPKDETVPPVVMPKEDEDKPIESKPIPIDSIVSPVQEEPTPQPLPIAPIYEKQKEDEAYFTFTFFGTEGKVRMPKDKVGELVALDNGASPEKIMVTWERLSDDDYDNLLRDCLELRIRHSLCDWAYLQMIRELSETYLGRGNAATFFMAWIYCQTGYQMRLALEEGNKLHLLVGSQHKIFNMPYYTIEDEPFYPFLHEGETINGGVQICGAAFPEEQPLSLQLFKEQEFAEAYGSQRTVRSKRYRDVSASFHVNQNLMQFYSTYPTSILGEDNMTRWALYANTPMASNIKEELYPQLQNAIAGKSQPEIVNLLLNWVQTGFEYEYDDKVWGHDRAFFAEESLYYPYCDCEDRSILLTRMVRDLLGLKCALVYYPGHLATAIAMGEEIKGDFIRIDGIKYLICDPTYIGAPIGMTMPDMDNQSAKVIVLN